MFSFVSIGEERRISFFLFLSVVVGGGLLSFFYFKNFLCLRGFLSGYALVQFLFFLASRRVLGLLKKKIVPRKIFKMFFLYYLLCYAVIAFLLFMAIRKSFLFFISFTLGLFFVKIGILADALFVLFKKDYFNG